ncbi:hypothetical protein [Streptomyces vastus]|uniref:Uncharacterized protein n=1 Tax=Streptomyces vastus TaxID=285451 RepID=A0ABN3QPA3_9ACTN
MELVLHCHDRGDRAGLREMVGVELDGAAQYGTAGLGVAGGTAHPQSGQWSGARYLTSWQHTASPLMVALVQEAAADIEERLLGIGSERERVALRAS